jgi:predicted DNA-binding WGR domain protein
MRTFEFREGTADKFWSISASGRSHTVRFGRRGTIGQEQTKEFSSEEAARKSYEKLIAEKVKKGYQETNGVARAPVAAPKVKQNATEAPSTQPVTAPTPYAGLHLAPEDWLFATWRPRAVRQRPPAPPFTLEDGMARFARMCSKSSYRHDWSIARLPVSMSKEEARFWLHAVRMLWSTKRAMVHYGMGAADPILAAALKADLADTPRLDALLEELTDRAAQNLPSASPVLLLPMAFLYSWEEVAAFVRDLPPPNISRHQWQFFHAEDDIFRTHMLAYLTEDELTLLGNAVRQSLDFSDPSLGTTSEFRTQLAPLVGLHDELLAYVGKHKVRFEWVLGLGSAQLVKDVVKANHVPIVQPRSIRGWLAHTELEELSTVTESLIPLGKSWGVASVQAFSQLVSAPVAAREFLRLVEDGKFTIEAQAWFDAHPREGIEGLAAAVKGNGRQAATARSIIQRLKRNLGEAVENAAIAVAPAARLPEGLAEAFRSARRQKVKPPKWVAAVELPPIILEDGRLANEDAEFVIALLASVPAFPPHPLLLALRCYATPQSLDAFAEELFNSWKRAGMNGKEKWALLAMGALGSERCALALAPYVREWPGEGKHQAAVWGLECFRLIGTDTALMQINQLAQKAKFQALKKKAQETMEAVAEDRGLSRGELEDRIVPDCGLDERGSRVFDFGPRQFQLRLGENLKPIVIDATGNRRDDLPKPSSKDDAAKSEAAVAEWKLLKKQISEVVKVQVARLEQALVTQRRWAPADFETLLVRHPIVGQLMRPLVWAVFDSANRIVGSFRITEEMAYADSSDNPFEVPQPGSIGLAHPAHLDEANKAAWGEVLADYELIQPFPQLARVMHRLTAAELRSRSITRNTDITMKPIVFAGICKRLGYMNGEVGDGGSYSSNAKWFETAGLTAIIQHSGLSIGYYETEPVHIEEVYFVRERFGRGDWFNEQREKVPLREVDEVVVSEILNDIAVLVSRGGEQ